MRNCLSFALVSRPGLSLSAALTVILLLAGGVSAGPRVKIEPAEIDLGTVEEGKQFDRFIELTNVGDGMLILEDVKTTCGCTAANVESVVELAAGESQSIKITFNSKRMEGAISKRITVHTNDEESPQTSIMLKANVHRPVRWVPKFITLNKVRAHEDFEEVIVLEADRNLGVKVSEFAILGSSKRADGRIEPKPSEVFDLELTDTRVEDDRDVFEFRVKIRPDVKPQKVTESIIALTNLGGDRDTMKTFIRGSIVGRISPSPTFAVLQMVDPGQEAMRDLVLTASEGTFKVLSAQVDNCPVEVTVIPHEDGMKTTIRLRYVGEKPGASGVRQLRIATDDPEQSLIEVPVRYQTRSPKAAKQPRKPPMTTSDVQPK